MDETAQRRVENHLCLENINVHNVLDIGTGTGVFAEMFSEHGLKVSGVDVNPEMVAGAHRYVPGGDFHVANAEVLDLPGQFL